MSLSPKWETTGVLDPSTRSDVVASTREIGLAWINTLGILTLRPGDSIDGIGKTRQTLLFWGPL